MKLIAREAEMARTGMRYMEFANGQCKSGAAIADQATGRKPHLGGLMEKHRRQMGMRAEACPLAPPVARFMAELTGKRTNGILVHYSVVGSI
jgi:hypothetical protein